MSTNRSAMVKLFCFVTLILSAFLTLVNSFLPLIKINTSGMFFTVLEIINKLSLLLGIAIGAYSYVLAMTKNKQTWLIIYWVAIVIYVVGTFLVLAK